MILCYRILCYGSMNGSLVCARCTETVLTVAGWSRSATAGAAAWDQGRYDRARSEPSTEPASPAETDDEFEADVDYDDVLAVMDSGHATRSPRSKRRRATSRGGKSYHDLTVLRTGDDDGLRKRQLGQGDEGEQQLLQQA